VRLPLGRFARDAESFATTSKRQDSNDKGGEK
jgi:hypothetical protein